MSAHLPTGKLVTVFGGSGFIGRYVVRALVERGHRVRVAVRRPDLAGHLQPLGSVGQIHAVQANVRVPYSVDAVTHGSDAVINLVGILQESGKQRFDVVQGKAPGLIAQAAKKAGVGHFVQMSAIGADAESESEYARSKAAGEAAVLEAFPKATILRPSIVFGPEDEFFNRFAKMARYSPALPLIGGGETKFQPVYCQDVGRAAAMAADGEAAGGKVYELGGPEVASFEELMRRMLKVIERDRFLVPVPWPVAHAMGAVLGVLPGAPLTSDQVTQLEHDNVVSGEAKRDKRTLAGLGIDAHGMAAILPSYLRRFRRTGEYNVRPAN
ncbi:complex I NDUFA9 subunit family protein [Tepidamorphus sp. 3E244]|uniref:complex I NDUFA9 subunit family protein n=1 Tax=Tepidamorphus sp. 3E244 TaxID=3385498 RepID=UPI0038FC98CF